MENITLVKTWIDKVAESENTRKSYASRINAFSKYVLEHHKLDLNTLRDKYRDARYAGAREQDKFLDWIHDIVESYLAHIRTPDHTPMTQDMYRSVIRSFLVKGCGIHDIEIQRPKHVFVTYHNRDLTKEDIQKILENVGLRDRTFFLMMAESGLRPDTLTKLRYRHIKQDYEAGRVPMKIDLPSSLLKTHVSARWTFIGEDGSKLLKEYLGPRGKLGDDDHVFQATRAKNLKGEIIGMETFSNIFSRAVIKTHMDETSKNGKPKQLHLYGLRKYFANNMRCDSVFREFWMGHTNMSDHYISTDSERHREEYSKGYESLRVYAPSNIEKALADSQAEIERLKTETVVLQNEVKELRTEREMLSSTQEIVGKLLQRVLELEKKLDKKT